MENKGIKKGQRFVKKTEVHGKDRQVNLAERGGFCHKGRSGRYDNANNDGLQRLRYAQRSPWLIRMAMLVDV
jgi:hypothetical protein